jgi:mannosyltransferase
VKDSQLQPLHNVNPGNAPPALQSRPVPGWDLAIWFGLAVGVGLRFSQLNRQSLWLDEGYTAWMVSHSPAQILRLVRADTAPPLYYLLLHAWTLIFGHSEIGLRSMSALASSLSLILVAAIANRCLNNKPAVAVAVWSLAFGFRQLYFAQEARFYALMALCVAATFLCILNHLQSGRRKWIVGISFLLTASLYIHNMMIPYVGALFLAWLLLPGIQPFGRRLADILLTAGIVAGLYAPWAIFCLPKQLAMVRQGFWVSRPTVTDIFREISSLMNVPSAQTWTQILAVLHIHHKVNLAAVVISLIVLVLLLLMAMIFQNGPRRREAAALFTVIFGPVLIIAIYSFFRTPVIMGKTFLPSATLMPILLLLPLNLALPKLPRRMLYGGAVVMLILTIGTYCGWRWGDVKENWRGAARVVADLPAHRRLIVFLSEDGQLPFDYYYAYRASEDVTGVPAGFFDRDPPRAMLRVVDSGDLGNLQTRLAAGGYDQVLLITCHLWWCDPKHLTEQFLRKKYPGVRSVGLGELSVMQFDAPDPESGPRWAGTDP